MCQYSYLGKQICQIQKIDVTHIDSKAKVRQGHQLVNAEISQKIWAFLRIMFHETKQISNSKLQVSTYVSWVCFRLVHSKFEISQVNQKS